MTNTYQTKQIKTDHKDLIQDIAFDFYGKRAATASLDQSLKIWNINEKNEWILKEELKINPGLYKVAWAHPEFGSLIAVACDRLVWIYEEACFGSAKAQHGWIKRSTISDALTPITDIKFAPKFLGLKLVVCSQNGEVRIYECNDILNSLTWTLTNSDLKTNFSSCSSCSWSTCFNLPILLALGSDESSANSDKLAIFEYNEGNRTYFKIDKITNDRQPAIVCTESIHSLAFAPSIGKLYHVLAIASKSLIVATIKPTKEPHKYTVTTKILDQDVSTWRVCWNTVGSILASAGDDKKVRLWKCNYIGAWRSIAEIAGDTCSILVDQNFTLSELQHRNQENQQQQNNNSNQKPYMPQQQQSNQTSVLFCTPVVHDQQNIKFSQNGALSKSKGVPWH